MSIFPPPRELHPVAKKMMERSRVVIPPADNPPITQEKPTPPADLPALIEFNPNGPDAAPEAAPSTQTTTGKGKRAEVRDVIRGKLLAEMRKRAGLGPLLGFISKKPDSLRSHVNTKASAAVQAVARQNEDQEFLGANLQEITDAVLACITSEPQGWRVYQDGLHCKDCRTPFNEVEAQEAARAVSNRRTSMARIFAREKDYGERDVRSVILTSEKLVDVVDRVCEVFELWEMEDTLSPDLNALYADLRDARSAGRQAMYPAIYKEPDTK